MVFCKEPAPDDVEAQQRRMLRSRQEREERVKREKQERQEKEASRARADALAAEVAAAVMAGADPFAATRANSVASPGSARSSPHVPRAAARRLDAFAARDGWGPQPASDSALLFGDDSDSFTAESTPVASPAASLPPYRAPPSPPRRMHDAFFSLGAREERRQEEPPESPPESPPSVAPRFEPAAAQAAQRLPFPPRAAGAGRGDARGDGDVGADVGVGPAAETRGRAATRARRASTSSSSSDSSSSSRSSSPDAAEASRSRSLPGVSLPGPNAQKTSAQTEHASPVERAARDAEDPEPPPPTPDLAFLVSASLGEARAQGSEAAPGTPDWSRLVEENLERRKSDAGKGGGYDWRGRV